MHDPFGLAGERGDQIPAVRVGVELGEQLQVVHQPGAVLGVLRVVLDQPLPDSDCLLSEPEALPLLGPFLGQVVVRQSQHPAFPPRPGPRADRGGDEADRLPEPLLGLGRAGRVGEEAAEADAAPRPLAAVLEVVRVLPRQGRQEAVGLLEVPLRRREVPERELDPAGVQVDQAAVQPDLRVGVIDAAQHLVVVAQRVVGDLLLQGVAAGVGRAELVEVEAAVDRVQRLVPLPEVRQRLRLLAARLGLVRVRPVHFAAQRLLVPHQPQDGQPDGQRGRTGERGGRRLTPRPLPRPLQGAHRPGADRLAGQEPVEVVGQLVGRGVAPVRPLLEALQADGLHVPVQPGLQAAWRYGFLVADLLERLQRGGGLERGPARQALVEDRPSA
ncbi:MAG: hypothetical protein ACRC33_20480 [Gemmataceae bacterium]